MAVVIRPNRNFFTLPTELRLMILEEMTPETLAAFIFAYYRLFRINHQELVPQLCSGDLKNLVACSAREGPALLRRMHTTFTYAVTSDSYHLSMIISPPPPEPSEWQLRLSNHVPTLVDLLRLTLIGNCFREPHHGATGGRLPAELQLNVLRQMSLKEMMPWIIAHYHNLAHMGIAPRFGWRDIVELRRAAMVE